MCWTSAEFLEGFALLGRTSWVVAISAPGSRKVRVYWGSDLRSRDHHPETEVLGCKSGPRDHSNMPPPQTTSIIPTNDCHDCPDRHRTCHAWNFYIRPSWVGGSGSFFICYPLWAEVGSHACHVRDVTLYNTSTIRRVQGGIAQGASGQLSNEAKYLVWVA